MSSNQVCTNIFYIPNILKQQLILLEIKLLRKLLVKLQVGSITKKIHYPKSPFLSIKNQYKLTLYPKLCIFVRKMCLTLHSRKLRQSHSKILYALSFLQFMYIYTSA
jgi:hypothetical protein